MTNEGAGVHLLIGVLPALGSARQASPGTGFTGDGGQFALAGGEFAGDRAKLSTISAEMHSTHVLLFASGNQVSAMPEVCLAAHHAVSADLRAVLEMLVVLVRRDGGLLACWLILSTSHQTEQCRQAEDNRKSTSQSKVSHESLSELGQGCAALPRSRMLVFKSPYASCVPWMESPAAWHLHEESKYRLARGSAVPRRSEEGMIMRTFLAMAPFFEPGMPPEPEPQPPVPGPDFPPEPEPLPPPGEPPPPRPGQPIP